MNPLYAEVTARWRRMFTQLEAGSDLPPSQRLRAEGLMEALVIGGEETPQNIQSAMDEVYRDVFGQSLAEYHGPDWPSFFPFPQIPAMARRAPVYPSTKD